MPKIPYRIIIPARYAASRLPGKPLLEIGGKPLIQHVYESACQANAENVLIATDDARIQAVALAFGAEVIMTLSSHPSGTDRLAEVVSLINAKDDELIVNLQGDEIDMPAKLIQQVAIALHRHPQCSIATICERISKVRDIDDPNIVKVVFNQHNLALYFSRAAIPYSGIGAQNHFKHIGLYAYRASYLKKFSATPACDLERQESLEQLRALYAGKSIYIEEACAPAGIGIDTQRDLEKVRRVKESTNLN